MQFATNFVLFLLACYCLLGWVAGVRLVTAASRDDDDLLTGPFDVLMCAVVVTLAPLLFALLVGVAMCKLAVHGPSEADLAAMRPLPAGDEEGRP